MKLTTYVSKIQNTSTDISVQMKFSLKIYINDLNQSQFLFHIARGCFTHLALESVEYYGKLWQSLT